MLPSFMKNYILKHTHIKNGNLNMELKNSEKLCFNPQDTSIIADMKIHSNKVFTNAFKKGDVGFGESYIKGHFTTSNLINLLTVFANNIDNSTTTKIINGKSILNRTFFNFISMLRKNSIKQSKKNISYHYDLGNDFYQLWLDESMTYSSALFKDSSQHLKDAQYNKYYNIISKLEEKLGNNLNILEIGFGFGGFAEVALQRGHKITGITLSKAQYDYANNRLKKYIDSKQCNFLIQDYRDMNDNFDAIVSIEMFEAVGIEYWDDYFKTIFKNLKLGGLAIIQTILIDNKIFENYKKTTDFIRHYIFPGGFLPTTDLFYDYARKNGLSVKFSEFFGKDYAKTLEIWLDIFNKKLDEIKSLGYSDEFIRMWQFYLAYCSAGFYNGRIDVAQIVLQK